MRVAESYHKNIGCVERESKSPTTVEVGRQTVPLIAYPSLVMMNSGFISKLL